MRLDIFIGALLLAADARGTALASDVSGCISDNSNSSTVSALLDSAQAVPNQIFASDISAFCRESSADLQYGQGGTNKAQLLSNVVPGGGWSYSEIPDLDVRRVSYLSGMWLYGITNEPEKLTSSQMVVLKDLRTGPLLEQNKALLNLPDSDLRQKISGTYAGSGSGSMPLAALESPHQTYDKNFGALNFSFSGPLFFAESVAVCAQLTLPGFQCARDLDQVANDWRPRDDGLPQLTNPESYLEVLGNPDKYTNGLKTAAQLLISRAENNDLDGANLFDDIKSSFEKNGVSTADADRFTWNTMGIIGTAGPNLGQVLAYVSTPKNTDRLKLALATITSLAPVLDEMSIQSGHIYSYPASVKSTCDSGKTYHFWLTAYLAHHLVLNGHSSPSGAAAAAFTAQKGYQMFSVTPGRTPSQPLTDPLFSPYSNTVREDLAYSSAGAIYGSRSAKGLQTEINVNDGLKAIISAARPIGRINASQADQMINDHSLRYLLDWDQVFAPNQAFKLYQRSNSGN
jgi:hypothetical protein